MPARSFACAKCGNWGKFAGPTCRLCKQLTNIERDPITTPPSNPSWRPSHFPPACPNCNGFAYTNDSNTTPWSRCRTCKAHPGHACSHEEWSTTRAYKS